MKIDGIMKSNMNNRQRDINYNDFNERKHNDKMKKISFSEILKEAIDNNYKSN